MFLTCTRFMRGDSGPVHVKKTNLARRETTAPLGSTPITFRIPNWIWSFFRLAFRPSRLVSPRCVVKTRCLPAAFSYEKRPQTSSPSLEKRSKSLAASRAEVSAGIFRQLHTESDVAARTHVKESQHRLVHNNVP